MSRILPVVGDIFIRENYFRGPIEQQLKLHFVAGNHSNHLLYWLFNQQVISFRGLRNNQSHLLKHLTLRLKISPVISEIHEWKSGLMLE